MLQLSVKYKNKSYSYELEDDDTVSQLKAKLEKKFRFPPERQNLYLAGVLLDSQFDDENLKELLEPFVILDLDVDFMLHLPKASSNRNQNFLLLGIHPSLNTLFCCCDSFGPEPI